MKIFWSKLSFCNVLLIGNPFLDGILEVSSKNGEDSINMEDVVGGEKEDENQESSGEESSGEHDGNQESQGEGNPETEGERPQIAQGLDGRTYQLKGVSLRSTPDKETEEQEQYVNEYGNPIKAPNPDLLRHAHCYEAPIFRKPNNEPVTPRSFALECAPLLVLSEEYNLNDPQVSFCSQIAGVWADKALARRPECFVDFCHHQMCLLSLIFYGIYFFPYHEITKDMPLCSQSFLAFIGSTHLIHHMAHKIRERQLTVERNDALTEEEKSLIPAEEEEITLTPEEVSPQLGREILEHYYMPESEWVIRRSEIRDILDSRKATCQKLRQKQMIQRRDDFKIKFKIQDLIDSGATTDDSKNSQSLIITSQGQSQGQSSIIGKKDFISSSSVERLNMYPGQMLRPPPSRNDPKNFEWIYWNGTNANPEVELRYRKLIAHNLVQDPKTGEWRSINYRDENGKERKRLKVGIILAVGNVEEVMRRYQPIINLWQCYARYHDMHFVIPTDDFNLRAHFRSANWFRWYMADQFLEHFDWLILVDPDQYIVPECWGYERFSFIEDILDKTDRHVVMRDIFPPQTLNNGLTMLRNSAQGRAFLDLLLEKIGWIQTFQHDQGAYDETILEVVGVVEAAYRSDNDPYYQGKVVDLGFLGDGKTNQTEISDLQKELDDMYEGMKGVNKEKMKSGRKSDNDNSDRKSDNTANEKTKNDGSVLDSVRRRPSSEDANDPREIRSKEMSEYERQMFAYGLDYRSTDLGQYDSICMPWLFPDVNGAHQIAAYSMCWWQNLKEFGGPSGNRTSKIIEFISPSWVDINHVVGYRGLSDPALLYHYAGAGKDFNVILANFAGANIDPGNKPKDFENYDFSGLGKDREQEDTKVPILERHHMGDCRRILDFVEKKMEEKQCIPGNMNAVKGKRCPPPLVVC